MSRVEFQRISAPATTSFCAKYLPRIANSLSPIRQPWVPSSRFNDHKGVVVAQLAKYTHRAPLDGTLLSIQTAVGSYVSIQGTYDPISGADGPVILIGGGAADQLSVRCYIDEITNQKFRAAPRRARASRQLAVTFAWETWRESCAQPPNACAPVSSSWARFPARRSPGYS